jgi:N-acetylmuramoyl-L-alanine amidase
VWKRWVLAVAALLAATIAGAASKVATGRVAPDIEAILGSDLDLSLLVRPHEGDAWTRLAKRVTGDATNWKLLAAANGDEDLITDRAVRVPFAMARPELQLEAITSLFPADRLTSKGWNHTVVVGSDQLEGEPLWKIAEWLTGDGASYAAIREANEMQRLSTRKGDVILIPLSLLTPAFRAASVSAEEKPKIEEKEETAAPDEEQVTKAERKPRIAPDASQLDYNRGGERPFAAYRLKKGEALYSAVVIRFTGRLYAKDVNDVVEQIVKFNGIDDILRLPVGYPVKIPMELLTAEYRPWDDPKRLAREKSKRESAQAARRVEARNLEGVQIILDAGHGGRDVGTEHDGVWESAYVYDVVCRLKRIIEQKSAAKVWITTRSKSRGYEVSDKNAAPNLTDQIVLTTPEYDLSDPAVGVNLRWYLANSIYRRAVRSGAAPEKVIFLSIHADSLHPSVRGAMAYIPGERFSEGTYRKRGSVYLARSEVKESPVVSQSREEALAAEGYSIDLADSIVDSISEAGLPVHPFEPIRDNVIRDGKEWVPAVIRYNKVPARLLLEICNLGNADDWKLIRTRRYRQSLAKAIYAGIIGFYDEGEPEKVSSRLAAR